MELSRASAWRWPWPRELLLWPGMRSGSHGPGRHRSPHKDIAAPCCKGFSRWASQFFPLLAKAQLPSSSNETFEEYFIFTVPQSDFSPESDLAVSTRSCCESWVSRGIAATSHYLSLSEVRQPHSCITYRDWSDFKAKMTVMLRSNLQSG